MIELPDVTLICIDCVNYSMAAIAIKKSMAQCKFAKVKFLTDVNMKIEDVETVIIPRIKSKDEYSKFCFYELYKHFDTEFVLVIQHDGYVLDGNSWDDSFVKYDYVAPPWTYIDGRNTGCGGFSLRSSKLQDVLGKDPYIEIYAPEDECLGRLYRNYLIEKHDIIFAPEELAHKFGFELNAPYQKTFGFHGNFHHPFKEHIVLTRTASLGDVAMLEPVIEYYAQKGFQVVLDTTPEFMDLFVHYPYQIKSPSECDSRIEAYKEISFDMAYEIKPMQLALRSYVEITGEDIPLRNSKLYFPVDPKAILFNKYILIHIDDTGMPYRNAQGIDWVEVVSYYTELGYLVFQIGKRTKENVAPHLNTSNIQTLMFIIAGAKLLIGIDSSPSQIAVAFGIPAVIFSGSVNLEYRYSDFTNIEVVHADCPSGKERFCYHETEGTTGSLCEFNQTNPPCVQYNHWHIIKSSDKLLRNERSTTVTA